jgi:ATP-binding cassette subfamily B protein
VLDGGVIVERGTHLDLLQAGRLYASMWNRQREAEAAREALAANGDEDADAPNRNPPQIDEIEPGRMPPDKTALEIIDAAE